MTEAQHPGYDFIEQYGTLPSCRRSLARCVRAYADFLRARAGQHEPPVDLAAICEEFGLTSVDAGDLGEIGLDGANVDALGLILVADEARETRRRYTLAHELVEKLVRALRGNVGTRPISDYLGETPRKERLCQWGASALLLPVAHVRAEVGGAAATIALASRVAARYDVSLLAALHAVVAHHPDQRTALLVWRLANKPTELRGAPPEGQGALFEEGYRALPPKAVRVWWSSYPQSLRRALVGVRDASTPEGSHVHEVLHGRATGLVRERVRVGRFDQTCDLDAQRVRLGDEACVVSLLTLPSAPASSASLFS